ncbi:MAG: hypothetical protein U0414_38210 [Polyangiaceae bacterium]
MKLTLRSSNDPDRVLFGLELDRRLLLAALPIAAGLVSQLSVAEVNGAWIKSGGTISSGALKADLVDLQGQISGVDARLKALEDAHADETSNGTYSQGAEFCGVGPVTNGAITGAYGGAKLACQAAGGACSATAHMCTAEELLRGKQSGNTPSTEGWYSTGVFASAGGSDANDCNGWTFGSDSTHRGAVWVPSSQPFGQGPFTIGCDGMRAILCCD